MANKHFPRWYALCDGAAYQRWGAMWDGIVKGLEIKRQQALTAMIAEGEIDPANVAQFFASNVQIMRGRTYEARFSALVGWLSAGRWPAFARWWNLQQKRERWEWRARFNLGGTEHPRTWRDRIKAA